MAKWHGPYQLLLTIKTTVKTAEHGWIPYIQVKVSTASEIWTSQMEEKDGKKTVANSLQKWTRSVAIEHLQGPSSTLDLQ